MNSFLPLSMQSKRKNSSAFFNQYLPANLDLEHSRGWIPESLSIEAQMSPLQLCYSNISIFELECELPLSLSLRVSSRKGEYRDSILPHRFSCNVKARNIRTRSHIFTDSTHSSQPASHFLGDRNTSIFSSCSSCKTDCYSPLPS